MPGGQWQEILEMGARHSVLIPLRTEAYDTSRWCVREFILAESAGIPIRAVDVRQAQHHSHSPMPFNAVPTVRVHHDNLMRIVLHAIATNLRSNCFGYDLQASVKVLPHGPTVFSLSSVGKEHDLVAYPSPKVTDEHVVVIEPFLGLGNKTVKLTTFEELG